MDKKVSQWKSSHCQGCHCCAQWIPSQERVSHKLLRGRQQECMPQGTWKTWELDKRMCKDCIHGWKTSLKTKQITIATCMPWIWSTEPVIESRTVNSLQKFPTMLLLDKQAQYATKYKTCHCHHPLFNQHVLLTICQIGNCHPPYLKDATPSYVLHVNSIC